VIELFNDPALAGLHVAVGRGVGVIADDRHPIFVLGFSSAIESLSELDIEQLAKIGQEVDELTRGMRGSGAAVHYVCGMRDAISFLYDVQRLREKSEGKKIG